MAAAVFLPAGFVALHAEWLFFTVADSADAVCANAERNQVLLDGGSATIAEREVVFGRAALIAVAFNDDFDLRIIAQEVGGLGERCARVGTDIGFIEIKVGVLHFLQKHLVEGFVARRRSSCGGRSDGDPNAGVGRAAWTAGGDGIGDGVGRA